VDRKRAGDQVGLRRSAPDLKAPELLARQIDRFVTTPVQVELEARSMRDDMRRNVENCLPRERVFLAQSIRIGQLHDLGHLGPQFMPVVNCSRNDRPTAALDRPQAPVIHGMISLH
jgi:hypothetical protein